MGERQPHPQPNQQATPADDLVPFEEHGQRCFAPCLSSRTVLRQPPLAVITMTHFVQVKRSTTQFLLLLFGGLSVATAQSPSGSLQPTGRDYFNELRDANAFNHYGDEYVCFPDEDKGGFAIVAKTKDIEKMMAANSAASSKPKPLGDALAVQTYFKGVASGKQIYDKVEKDSDEEWALEFKSPLHGKMVYMINWTTGRYRLLIFALDKSKTLPASEISGRCELIHPLSPPPK